LLKTLPKAFTIIICILSSCLCFGNDTILIRNNNIIDIQFSNDRLQIKDVDGCYEYLKFDWQKVKNFPLAISCPFQSTFNGSPVVDSLSAFNRSFYAISNTLVEGCDDFTLSNSFPSKITCLSPYNDKNILVGTAQDGIYVCNGEEKQKLFIPNLSLPETIIQLEQLNSDIIINSGNTISTFNQSSLELKNIYSSKYPIQIEVDNLQNLWIVDANKLVCNSDYFRPELSTCKITSFEADAEKITRDTKIDIVYFSYFPKNQSEVEYSYRLDGGTWTQTKNESVHFTGLNPGQHIFEVRSSLGAGVYSLPVKKPFRVASTLKDSIWPIIFGLTGLLLLGFLYALRKQNSETTELKRSKEKLLLENELLKSKQKVLELQMNPHFLFNTLNSIQGLIALGKNKVARQYLKEFSQIMRSILQSSREENISISEELKFLKNYMSLERMARNDKFDFEMEIGDGVDKEKKIPVMILQALLENAIIHGVAPMHGKGHIVLKLNDDGGKLKCHVVDNGVGMGYEKKDSLDHKSYARDIIKERLKKYRIKDIEYRIPSSGQDPA